MCADIITGGTHLESGQIKIYAIAAAERNPALASVPTTVEAGLPEFQVSAWNGLFAPKATPKPIIDTLADALDKALDDDVTRKRLLVLGCDIPDKPKRGPEPFLALVKSEIARWTPIIQAANVKVE
jgi:putative tricarboxylic transport membrane protein